MHSPIVLRSPVHTDEKTIQATSLFPFKLRPELRKLRRVELMMRTRMLGRRASGSRDWGLGARAPDSEDAFRARPRPRCDL